MPDLAPARTPHELHFADRERREVVVQHETPIRLAFDGLDFLLIVRRSQGDSNECLRLAACEYGRPVGTRQHSDFGPDGTNLIELATVQADAAFEDLVAKNFFFQLFEDGLRFDFPL